MRRLLSFARRSPTGPATTPATTPATAPATTPETAPAASTVAVMSGRPSAPGATVGDGRDEQHSATGLWSDRTGRWAVRSAQALLILVLAACVVLALTELKLLVVPILIAGILAAALSPLARFLRERGWPRMLATWTSLLLGLGVLGTVLWLVGRGIRREWSTLVEEADRGLTELERFLVDGPLGITPEQIAAVRESAGEILSSDRFQSGALAGAAAAAETVAGMLLGLVFLFFLLKDGRSIYAFFLRPLSRERQERAWRVGDKGVDVLGGYVRGTAVVALVDALVIGVALAVLGVPLALPLATIVFLGAFIPLIGATLAGTLAALVALVANGPTTALIVVVVVIAVNQLEGDLLAPVVLGKALSLHPLAILLALTAGTILAGIIGALLAVPIAAVAWAAVKEWEAGADDDAALAPAEGTG